VGRQVFIWRTARAVETLPTADDKELRLALILQALDMQFEICAQSGPIPAPTV